MCGIWASLSCSDAIFSNGDYHQMLEKSRTVSARGPDRGQVVVHPRGLFVFYRLAFHDLSLMGDQPFTFFRPDGGVVFLVANGEIYNSQVLIQEKRFQPRSDNDCEVIFHLAETTDWDPYAIMDHLDGEFAFLLVEMNGNGRVKRALAGRDPYGVRPLFWETRGETIWSFASLAAGLKEDTKPFPPGTVLEMRGGPSGVVETRWHSCTNFPIVFLECGIDVFKKGVCDRLIAAVKKRMSGERPIAALLSGGLDSSLVCAIAVRLLGKTDLATFSIGMEGSTDLVHARAVAAHLGTRHYEVLFTPEEGIAVVDEVIRSCETWDITTIRASIGQHLLAKHIAESTPFRAILNGDGADEAEMGYLYWHNAPSPSDAHDESVRRLREIYLYDGLRVDRSLGRFGLEARLPYLDKEFVEFYLRVPPEWRMPGVNRMEKHLIREAFADFHDGLLPDAVLWRTKEAFSDGVSSVESPWFRTLQGVMESRVSDQEFATPLTGFAVVPPSKEAFYYQKKFGEFFGSKKSGLIPGYWLPRWSGEISEPSARVLPIYSNPSEPTPPTTPC